MARLGLQSLGFILFVRALAGSVQFLYSVRYLRFLHDPMVFGRMDNETVVSSSRCSVYAGLRGSRVKVQVRVLYEPDNCPNQLLTSCTLNRLVSLSVVTCSSPARQALAGSLHRNLCTSWTMHKCARYPTRSVCLSLSCTLRTHLLSSIEGVPDIFDRHITELP